MVALAMGERGQLARLLAAKRGGVLTFGALKAGKESAPGQPTIQQLRKLYRLDQHGPDTKASLTWPMRPWLWASPAVWTCLAGTWQHTAGTAEAPCLTGVGIRGYLQACLVAWALC